ncbi:FecR domain-containing protein [Pseudomonas sp. NPDC089534]|uniref:FecR domain-containing protein n=1 Tax=Pseudomonas sp. NPDC089534 TaxID=3364468 RepID=UPI0037FE04DB
MNPPTDFSSQVAEQAVHWLLEMQQGPLDPRRQQAWQQWFEAHSEHRRAWEHIQRVNARLRGLSSPLAHAALNAPRSAGRRQALKLLLLLGAGSALTWGMREHNPLPSLLADYRTPVGARRRIALPSGGQLQLNTASAVDVRANGPQPRIRLLEGEMLLTAARAIEVQTAHGLLTARDARLNVRQFADRTQVALFEGQVELTAAGRAPVPLPVARQLSFGDASVGAAQPLDANSGAWADGMLVAAHMRLGDFLDELGRYRRGQLHCDSKVADLLISGTYPLDDSERILDLLQISLPVKVRRFTRYWVSVEAKA